MNYHKFILHALNKLGQCLLIILAIAISIPGLGWASTSNWKLNYGTNITETWNNNINNTNYHETSDFITTLSPHITLNRNTEYTDLSASYSMPITYYHRHSKYNFVGNTLNLNWNQHLLEHLTYFLAENFYTSNKAVETTDNVTSLRKSRKSYYRISTNTGFTYIFGPKDSISASYHDIRLQNKDPNTEDTLSYGPKISIAYWLEKKIGVNIAYAFDRREYEVTIPNYTSTYTSGITYIISQYLSTHINYIVARYHSESPSTEDYTSQSASIGISYKLTQHISSSASIGYSYRNPTRSKPNSGITYSLSLNKKFERGNISISNSGGYREEYIEVDRKGYTRYRSSAISASYKLYQHTTIALSTSYSNEKSDSEADNRDETWTTSASIHQGLLRWLSGFASLSYSQRTPMDSGYRDTKVIVGLSAHGMTNL